MRPEIACSQAAERTSAAHVTYPTVVDRIGATVREIATPIVLIHMHASVSVCATGADDLDRAKRTGSCCPRDAVLRC